MLKQRSIFNKFLLIVKGFAMGAVNKVPGVSGGIVALVSGFYVELIYSIQKINLKSLKLLYLGRWRVFFNYINGEFLFYLFGGSIISFFSISLILDFLITNYSNYLWSSFFGMVICSIYFIKTLVKKWGIKTYFFFLVGLIIGVSISLSDPIKGSESLPFIFFCGVISVSGMVLPGLSGSFLLLLLGSYELLLVDSVNALFYSIKDLLFGNLDFIKDPNRMRLLKIILVFVFGSITGLVLFVNILSFVLKKFYSFTIAMILGFVSGSLICLWPWRYIYLEKEIYYFPSEISKELVLMIICIKLGAGFVYALEKYGRQIKG